MTDEEYDERMGTIEKLALHFPTAELTEKTVKSYVWSLSDLSQITLRAAIEKCVATSKFFPSVAEIRENASAVVTEGKGGSHPDSCACFGVGWIVPEKVDGYSPGARRCEGVTGVMADDNDSDIDRNW